VIQALYVNPGEETVAVASLDTIAKLASRPKLKAVGNRASKAVILAMQLNLQSAGVQRAGSSALAALAANPQSCAEAVNHGAVECCLNGIRMHPEKDRVIAACCKALTAFSGHRGAKGTIMEEVGAVIEACARLNSHENVASAGARLMAQLCEQGSLDERRYLLRSGCLEIMIAALQLHQANEKTTTSILATLLSFAESDEGRVQFHDRQAARALADIVVNADDVAAKALALGVICRLAEHGNHVAHEGLVICGVIPAALHVLARHGRVEAVVLRCLSLLYALAANVHAREVINEQQGDKLVAEVRNRFADSPTLEDSASRLLARLLADDMLLDEMKMTPAAMQRVDSLFGTNP